MFLLNLLLFVAACTVLVKSSGYLLRTLLKISSFLRINEFSVGFIIMSVSTTVPELTVGIVSAFRKEPELVLGTAIGSVIANLTIIIGIVVVLARNIKMNSRIVRTDLVYMVIIVFAPLILMLDNFFWNMFGLSVPSGLSRIDGIILVSLFIFYILKIVSQENRHHHPISTVSKKELLKNLIYFILSLTVILISAQFTVEYAGYLSVDIGFSKLLMGLLIVALGTSLPDLVFQSNAVMKHHEDMAIGDLIGGVISNATLVLGVSAIISPITGNLFVFVSSGFFMIIVAFIFMTFAESGKELTWKEGMSLIFLYLFFIIGELFMRNINV